MEKKVNASVRQILDDFLEHNNRRKTPERYAILDAVYGMSQHFSLEELGDYLEQNNFRVSRATLYNTMRLFLELRLVVRHRLLDGTKYEAWFNHENHCHQICTLCGKVSEIDAPGIVAAIDETKYKRFRKDGFALYVYGVCSSCTARKTRRNSAKQKSKDNKQINKNKVKG